MSKHSHISASFDNAFQSRAGSPDVYMSMIPKYNESFAFMSTHFTCIAFFVVTAAHNIVLKSKFIVAPDVLSYSMPIGGTTKNRKVSSKDTFYNGVITKTVNKGGTAGILTDGKFGRDDSKKKGNQGEVWVGLSQEFCYIIIY